MVSQEAREAREDCWTHLCIQIHLSSLMINCPPGWRGELETWPKYTVVLYWFHLSKTDMRAKEPTLDRRCVRTKCKESSYLAEKRVVGKRTYGLHTHGDGPLHFRDQAMSLKMNRRSTLGGGQEMRSPRWADDGQIHQGSAFTPTDRSRSREQLTRASVFISFCAISTLL